MPSLFWIVTGLPFYRTPPAFGFSMGVIHLLHHSQIPKMCVPIRRHQQLLAAENSYISNNPLSQVQFVNDLLAFRRHRTSLRRLLALRNEDTNDQTESTVGIDIRLDPRLYKVRISRASGIE